ncbi:uncharacterized protein G2W53_026531 [Senna tora]|uniref:Uncharacterized protein n=1 Tax=Senna tora TaxID=362788 RepID=A0A834WIX4_9FABA|nr:uncharacterized protein G2W53_026531 [Senna tora]
MAETNSDTPDSWKITHYENRGG